MKEEGRHNLKRSIDELPDSSMDGHLWSRIENRLDHEPVPGSIGVRARQTIGIKRGIFVAAGLLLLISLLWLARDPLNPARIQNTSSKQDIIADKDPLQENREVPGPTTGVADDEPKSQPAATAEKLKALTSGKERILEGLPEAKKSAETMAGGIPAFASTLPENSMLLPIYLDRRQAHELSVSPYLIDPPISRNNISTRPLGIATEGPAANPFSAYAGFDFIWQAGNHTPSEKENLNVFFYGPLIRLSYEYRNWDASLGAGILISKDDGLILHLYETNEFIKSIDYVDSVYVNPENLERIYYTSRRDIYDSVHHSDFSSYRRSYTYFSFPFTVGYKLPITPAISLDWQLGLTYMHQNKYYDGPGTFVLPVASTVLQTQVLTPERYANNFRYHVSFGAGFKLIPSIDLMANFSLGTLARSWYKSDELKINTLNYGFNIGFRYKIH